jgi:hypothetical protein
MPSKKQIHSDGKATAEPRSSRRGAQNFETLTHKVNPLAVIQRDRLYQRALTPQDVLQLQHTIGNQAFSRLLQGRPSVQREAEEEEQLQTKSLVQRQELEQDELQIKPDIEQAGVEGGQVDLNVEVAINQTCGGGQPLEGAVQKQMSETLGYDFSRVRVHTGSESDALNQQLTAKAFTTGPDIFFKRGAYDPISSRDRELIAHELTHVVQQGTGRVSGHGSGMIIRRTGDVFEQEADAQARRASSDENKRQRGMEARAHKIARRATAHPSMTTNRGRIVQRLTADTRRTNPTIDKKNQPNYYGWTVPERIIPTIEIKQKGKKLVPEVTELWGEISLQTKPPPKNIIYVTEKDATPDNCGKMIEDLKKLGWGEDVKYYAEAAVKAHEEVHASSDKDVLTKNASNYAKQYVKRLYAGLKGKSKGDKEALEKEAGELMQKESKATPQVRYSPHNEWYYACQKQGVKDHDTAGGTIKRVEWPVVKQIIDAIETRFKGAESVSVGMTEAKESEELTGGR